MPVLNAEALETDPEGMELLRSVLRTGRRKAPAVSAFKPTQAVAQPITIGRPAKAARKQRPMLLAEAPH
jgi:hypothetical protein